MSKVKGEKWAKFASASPREAALVQSFVTKAVMETEHHLGDLPGEEKKELAAKAALESIQKLIKAGSPFFGAYAPLISIAADLLPFIYDAIDGIVDWLYETGDFQHQAEGVA